MQDGYSSVVWSTSAAQASQLVAIGDDAFAAEVDAALHGEGRYDYGHPTSALGAAASLFAFAAPQPGRLSPPRCGAAPARRGSFPLALRHAGVYSAPRLALVGDAAHAVHPLAGQGLNLGISDAALLAHTLEQAVATGRDLGEVALLAQFGAEAARANAPMLVALDGAHTLSLTTHRCYSI